MKKQYFLTLALIICLLTGLSTTTQAQVTGMPAGYTTDFPQISTAQNPIWYSIMSSNYGTNIEQRRNRFIYWDGTTFGADKIDAGITSANQSDKYLWRLEQAVSTNDDNYKYVYLVSKYDGKKVGDATAPVLVTDGAVELKLGKSQKIKDDGLITAEVPVVGQFFLKYEPAGSTDIKLLNTSGTYVQIWFNAYASVTKSSGWFFYPSVATKVETVKENLLSVYPNPFVNEIQIDSKLEGVEKVEIYNVQGAQVARELVNPYTVNTSSLQPGLYLVKAYANGVVYTSKLVKSAK